MSAVNSTSRAMQSMSGISRESVGRAMFAGDSGELVGERARAMSQRMPGARQCAKNDFRYDDRAERAEMKPFRLRLLHRLDQDEERQRRIIRYRFDVFRREPAIGRGGHQPVTELAHAPGAIGKQP